MLLFFCVHTESSRTGHRYTNVANKSTHLGLALICPSYRRAFLYSLRLLRKKGRKKRRIKLCSIIYLVLICSQPHIFRFTSHFLRIWAVAAARFECDAASCWGRNKKPSKCDTRHQTTKQHQRQKRRRTDSGAVAWKKIYDKFVSHSFALIRCSTFYLCFVFGSVDPGRPHDGAGDVDPTRMARRIFSSMFCARCCEPERKSDEIVWRVKNPFSELFSIWMHRAQSFR